MADKDSDNSNNDTKQKPQEKNDILKLFLASLPLSEQDNIGRNKKGSTIDDDDEPIFLSRKLSVD